MLRRKGQRGFTIAEIMVTVAIVGTVSAVAIPGFMRMRMDTNMQLVKQHMRVIGEKMQEIYINKGQYPDESRWPLTGATDPDEMVITSGLSAINAKGYTTNEYSRSTPAAYQFCSSPVTNTAGSKRFCVHCDSSMSALFAPGQVEEVPQGNQPFRIDSYNNGPIVPMTNYTMNYALSDPTFMRDDFKSQMEFIANLDEYSKLSTGAYLNPPRALLAVSLAGESETFMNAVKEANEDLKNKGIHLYQVDPSVDPNYAHMDSVYSSWGYKVYILTAKYDQPPDPNSVPTFPACKLNMTC
ncbi:MAG: type II secretion system protein [Candidatus Omnitrophica bacterium]|nr:type II secretion system protein [Candidatus Omnitrophota bacterium]